MLINVKNVTDTSYIKSHVGDAPLGPFMLNILMLMFIWMFTE